jgi:hypothetical protein
VIYLQPIDKLKILSHKKDWIGFLQISNIDGQPALLTSGPIAKFKHILNFYIFAAVYNETQFYSFIKMLFIIAFD